MVNLSLTQKKILAIVGGAAALFLIIVIGFLLVPKGKRTKMARTASQSTLPNSTKVDDEEVTLLEMKNEEFKAPVFDDGKNDRELMNLIEGKAPEIVAVLPLSRLESGNPISVPLPPKPAAQTSTGENLPSAVPKVNDAQEEFGQVEPSPVVPLQEEKSVKEEVEVPPKQELTLPIQVDSKLEQSEPDANPIVPVAPPVPPNQKEEPPKTVPLKLTQEEPQKLEDPKPDVIPVPPPPPPPPTKKNNTEKQNAEIIPLPPPNTTTPNPAQEESPAPEDPKPSQEDLASTPPNPNTEQIPQPPPPPPPPPGFKPETIINTKPPTSSKKHFKNPQYHVMDGDLAKKLIEQRKNLKSVKEKEQKDEHGGSVEARSEMLTEMEENVEKAKSSMRKNTPPEEQSNSEDNWDDDDDTTSTGKNKEKGLEEGKEEAVIGTERKNVDPMKPITSNFESSQHIKSQNPQDIKEQLEKELLSLEKQEKLKEQERIKTPTSKEQQEVKKQKEKEESRTLTPKEIHALEMGQIETSKQIKDALKQIRQDISSSVEESDDDGWNENQ